MITLTYFLVFFRMTQWNNKRTRQFSTLKTISFHYFFRLIINRNHRSVPFFHFIGDGDHWTESRRRRLHVFDRIGQEWEPIKKLIQWQFFKRSFYSRQKQNCSYPILSYLLYSVDLFWSSLMINDQLRWVEKFAKNPWSIIFIRHWTFDLKRKMMHQHQQDDDDNYPGKLLQQAALYLNVDLLKVKTSSNFFFSSTTVNWIFRICLSVMK